jgi:hypothetical protein
MVLHVWPATINRLSQCINQPARSGSTCSDCETLRKRMKDFT